MKNLILFFGLLLSLTGVVAQSSIQITSNTINWGASINQAGPYTDPVFNVFSCTQFDPTCASQPLLEQHFSGCPAMTPIWATPPPASCYFTADTEFWYYTAFDVNDDLHCFDVAANVTIQADQSYTLFINGTQVGSSEDEQWGDVFNYDVANLITQGANEILVRVNNAGGQGCNGYNYAFLAFCLDIDIDYMASSNDYDFFFTHSDEIAADDIFTICEEIILVDSEILTGEAGGLEDFFMEIREIDENGETIDDNVNVQFDPNHPDLGWAWGHPYALDIRAEFENPLTPNPIDFEVGSIYEVTIISIITVRGCPEIIEVTHQFTIIEGDCCVGEEITFVFEHEDGTADNVFSFCEGIFLNATGTTTSQNAYFMQLCEYDPNGDVVCYRKESNHDDQWTSWGDPTDNNPLNLGENFIHPVTGAPVVFTIGNTYTFKIALWLEDCGGWTELLQTFTIEEGDCCEGLIQFHFQHKNTVQDNVFSVCEDVFLDASGTTTLQNSYFMQLCEYDPNGDIVACYVMESNHEDTGWSWGDPTDNNPINIRANFIHQNTGAPLNFTAGNTYTFKIAMWIIGCGWTEVLHEFTIEDDVCCEDFNDASFTFGDTEDTPINYSLVVQDFDTYAEFGTTHEWYIYSSPDLSGNSLTPVHFTTTTGPGPVTIFDDAQYGLWYTVIHKIISDCGEVCFQFIMAQAKNKNGQKDDGISGPAGVYVDCSITDDFFNHPCEDLAAPTGLFTGAFSLHWNPVAGADHYIIYSVSNPFMDPCGCRNPAMFGSISVINNYYTLPPLLKNECFAWEVIAVCSDGTQSPASTPSCFGNLILPIMSTENGSTATSIYPNPSNGRMSININLSYDSEVSIGLYDVVGHKVNAFNETIQAKANHSISLNWDGSGQLSAGIYFVKFQTNTENFTKTIVIE